MGSPMQKKLSAYFGLQKVKDLQLCKVNIGQIIESEH